MLFGGKITIFYLVGDSCNSFNNTIKKRTLENIDVNNTKANLKTIKYRYYHHINHIPLL